MPGEGVELMPGEGVEPPRPDGLSGLSRLRLPFRHPGEQATNASDWRRSRGQNARGDGVFGLLEARFPFDIRIAALVASRPVKMVRSRSGPM